MVTVLCQRRPNVTIGSLTSDHLHSRHHQTSFNRRVQGDLLYVHLSAKVPFSADDEAVIQELMQTDLHRVIRTQQLTDDHCQVRLMRSA